MPEKYKHSRAETNVLRRDLRWIFERGDERELMKILRKHGIKDEDPRFSEIVALSAPCGAGRLNCQGVNLLAQALGLAGG